MARRVLNRPTRRFPARAVAMTVCACCLWCFEKIIKYLSHNACATPASRDSKPKRRAVLGPQEHFKISTEL
jgi:hypothetical protein